MGSVLVLFLPVFWIKLAGGVIMIGFAIYEFLEVTREAGKIEKLEDSRLKQDQKKKSSWAILLSAISMLVVLDLAGDATEVLTIVFVARFGNGVLVFVSCVAALVLASAVETAIGNRLGRFLKPARVRYLSLFVFLIIGLVIIVATIFFP